MWRLYESGSCGVVETPCPFFNEGVVDMLKKVKVEDAVGMAIPYDLTESIKVLVFVRDIS